MEIYELEIPGVYRVEPKKLDDARGCFYEGFRVDALCDATGRDFSVAQINYSASHRNTLRGIHGVLIPPGQAKYVTCVRGALLDIALQRQRKPARDQAEMGSRHRAKTIAGDIEGNDRGLTAVLDHGTIGARRPFQRLVEQPHDVPPPGLPDRPLCSHVPTIRKRLSGQQFTVLARMRS